MDDLKIYVEYECGIGNVVLYNGQKIGLPQNFLGKTEKPIIILPPMGALKA